MEGSQREGRAAFGRGFQVAIVGGVEWGKRDQVTATRPREI